MSIQTQINRLKSAKTNIINAIKGKGVTVPSSASMDDLSALIESIQQGGSSVKVASGTYTNNTQMTGNTSTTNSTYYREVTHNLGEVPDLVIVYAPSNVAQTYSMLMAMRWNTFFTWRASNYTSICAYHGNNSSSVSCANVTTSYGIISMTSTYFRFKTYSSSTSYYWRTGTYNWVAVKF